MLTQKSGNIFHLFNTHPVLNPLFTLIYFLRCGQETRVIPRILQMRSHWLKSQKESVRLEEAGISKNVSI